MIDRIQQTLYRYLSPESMIGLFFSAFDAQGVLITSHGVLQTDKPASQLIPLLYNGIFAPLANKTNLLICDIVKDIKQEDDTTALLAYDPQQYGLIITTIDGTKSGVLLPQTAGVSDMKSALLYLKSKYAIGGNVTMGVFTTQRITIG